MNRVERIMRELPDDGLPDVAFSLERSCSALVVVDPQACFLDASGWATPLLRESLEENATIGNLQRLLAAASRAGIPLFVCPHSLSASDRGWRVGGTMELMMQMASPAGSRESDSHPRSPSPSEGWLDQFRPFVEADSTVICNPHKCYGPETTDLRLQLHKRGIHQVLLAGVSANLCVEAHLRSLLESGFEVAVVADATAAIKTPGLDGFLAAFINYRMLASTVWCTAFAVSEIERCSGQPGVEDGASAIS